MTGKMNICLEGLLFGLSLQIAIGPVCMFILSVATTQGFREAESGVAGVVLIDALYITLSMAGFSGLMNSDKRKKILGYSGVLILILFGIKMGIDAFSITAIGAVHADIPGATVSPGIFLTACALTASNPLTIVFWAGVFGAKIAAKTGSSTSVGFFSAGCILSTALFLSAVAIAGSIARFHLPVELIRMLNLAVAVGILLFAGLRFKKIRNHGRRSGIA